MAAEYICTVDGAQTDASGPGGPVVSISFTDTNGTFAKTYFSVPDAVRREMLAQALAAISTGSQVLAVLDDPQSDPRQCYLLSVLSGA